VGLIQEGSTTFSLGGHVHHAEQGHIVAIGPGRAHSCNPNQGTPISYALFYLAPEWFAPGTRGTAFPEFDEPVIADRELFERWVSVYRLLKSDPATADDTGLREAVATLIARHARPCDERISPEDLDCIEAAKRLLAERLGERVTIAEIAAAAHVSRSHLSRVFAAAEGLPPHTYQNQLRVERAKALLADGAAPAEAGALAGFSDQSHFTRVFRAFTGATPRQYQAGSTH
jgi:AraC-like DNA-binding protein